MKRLLFLINLMFCLCVIACHPKPATKSDVKIASDSINEKIVKTDSSNSSATKSNLQNIKPNTTNNNLKGKGEIEFNQGVIIHNSPNQRELDSIKKIKQQQVH